MSRHRLHTFLGGLLLVLALANSSRILVFAPMPTKSHTLVFEGISIALAEAGHQVILVSAHEFVNPSTDLKHVVLTGMSQTQYSNTLERKNMSPPTLIALVSTIANAPLTEALSHENMKTVMATSSFDLVIFEQLCTEALVGLGQHFGAPLIAVSTYGFAQHINDLVANPSSLSHVRHAFANYPPTMNLISRLKNVVLHTYEQLLLNYVNMPNQVNRAQHSLKMYWFCDQHDYNLYLSENSLRNSFPNRAYLSMWL